MAIYAGHASIDAYTMGRSIRQLEMAVSIGVQALATRGGFREFRKGECLGSARSRRSKSIGTGHSDGYSTQIAVGKAEDRPRDVDSPKSIWQPGLKLLTLTIVALSCFRI